MKKQEKLIENEMEDSKKIKRIIAVQLSSTGCRGSGYRGWASPRLC
jgi:hypothetical protein